MPDVTLAAPSTPVRRIVTAAATAWFAWALLWLGAHDGATVAWDCAAGTCATNDLAGPAPAIGAALLVVTLMLARQLAQRATLGLVVAWGASALVAGWQGAAHDHLITAADVRLPVVVASVVGAAGALGAIIGGIASLRRSGATARWFRGHRAAWARVSDVESVSGHGTWATVHFDDEHGVRHEVRTSVPREAVRVPVRALYDPTRPDDPARLRLGIPASPPSAAANALRIRLIRIAVPLAADDDPSASH